MLELLVAACLATADGGVEAVVPVEAITEDAGVALADSPYAEADAGALAPSGGMLSASADAERRDGKAEFVKGELSVYLGSDRLTVKNTRIGVTVGPDLFAGALYALIEPLVDLRFFDGKLGIGVGVPLRIELVNLALANPIERIGRVRIEDYDSVHDFGRILKYVTFGRKEDNIYVSAGQRYASSVGHGAITRRYSPSIDTDYPRASAQVDMYNDYGGFELMTNDLLEWNQISGLAFLKPFSFFKPQNVLLKSLSIGVTGAMDWKAPYSLSGIPTQRVTMANRLAVTSVKPVRLIGFDAEVKVVKTDNIDIKPYVDYSMLIDGDGGFTAGVLGRFNVGTEIKNAFRVIAEARFLGNRYAPSYFDTFYEIDRMAYLNADFRDPGAATALYIPKGQYVLEHGLGQRFGYYFEASWGIRNAVGLTLAFEGVSNAPPKNFVAHLELPVLSFLQLFGSYYLRGVNSFDELAQLGPFGLKSILFAGARLRVLPFLFINGRVYKTFRVNPTLERYDNQFGFSVDLELGYEFQKASPPPPPKLDDDKTEKQDSAPSPSPSEETPPTPQLPNPAEQSQPMSPSGMR